MKVFPRISLNIIAPPLIGWLFMIGYDLLVEHQSGPLIAILIGIVFVYMFAIVPTLLHSIVMEFIYRRVYHPDDFHSIIAAAISGGVYGSLTWLLLNTAWNYAPPAPPLWPAALIGTVSGGLTGWIITTYSRKGGRSTALITDQS